MGLNKSSGYLERFSTSQKVAHFVISLSILFLLLTGLPITFSSLRWVMDALGGSEVTMFLHRLFALLLGSSVVYFGVYFLLERIGREKEGKEKSNGGSKLITTQLIKDSIKDMLWALNLSDERPKFDKYDWIMVADIIGVPILVIIIGVTGILMWFPHLYIANNPALFFAFRTIHAFFAIFFLFFVLAHAGILHLTPGNFPMNLSIFTGLIEEEKARIEHPLWVEKAKRVEGAVRRFGMSGLGYVAFVVSLVAFILLAYTTFVMVDEGLAGLRAEGSLIVAIGLDLSVLIVLAYLIATVVGGIYGAFKRV